MRVEDDLLHGFVVHHLWFTCQALSALALPPQGGAALRGALFGVLRRMEAQSGAPPEALTPVQWLLAHENAASQRGIRVPAPYTIEPALANGRTYQPGEALGFGLSLFGQATALLPLVVDGIDLVGHEGVGRPLDRNGDARSRGGARGRFTLRGIEAVNPLTGARRTLMNAAREVVALPDIPVTWAQAQQAAATLPADRLTLHFLTPTRIVDEGRLVHRPLFRPLFQRLLERLISLCETFGGGKPDLDARALVDAAGEVRLVEDHTRWVDLHSGSRRLGRSTPIGGFVGAAAYAGDLAPFLPFLLMGQSTHVGKSAVKGDGWYEVVKPRPER